jgi:hypothetical protein
MTGIAVDNPMHVYSMRMYNERLQILISKDQRRRLEQEAKRRGASVASVIRDAVDSRLGGVSREDRVAAVETIAAMKAAPYLPPEQLAAAIDDSHREEIERGLDEGRSR